MEKAVILCSGGLDSVITSFYVKSLRKYNSVEILFFNYGQNSLENERKFSKKCAKKINAKFKEIKIDLSDLKVPLISGKKVKDGKSLKNTSKESLQWYVPMRNMIFLSHAMAIVKSEKTDIYVGFKNEGRENYPDTTKEFVDSMNKVADSLSKGRIRIIAPLLKLDKEDVVSLGKKLKVNFKETYSCYIGRSLHCGKCLACRLRKAGFYWSGVDDPTEYLK